MSLSSESPTHIRSAKRAPGGQASIAAAVNAPARPTTFFLRSERDLANPNNSCSPPRSRRASQDSADNLPQANSIAIHDRSWVNEEMADEETFDVRSLDETIAPEESIAGLSHDSVDHNNGGNSDAALEAIDPISERKRKTRNPVHPKIVAAGQRILSAEQRLWTPLPASSACESRAPRANQRRGSGSSSICLSQPFTPLRISPKVGYSSPSTARSTSPKSFRLSDEEASAVGEAASQHIESSSSGEEQDGGAAQSGETKDSSMPQLVMPSLALPMRRPFTDRGRRMGKLRVMLIGAQGVGKTSLIQTISRVCKDIVHLDPVDAGPTEAICEIGASSRPYPSWWRDSEASRRLSRQKSLGESVLERNITFIDTPGLDVPQGIAGIQSYVDAALESTAQLRSMDDGDIASMLTGDGGGVNIDAVLYLIDATLPNTTIDAPMLLSSEERDLLSYLCRRTNVIPIISRLDRIAPEQLAIRTEQVSLLFQRLGVEVYPDGGPPLPGEEIDNGATAFFATSSALGDDSETIDASLLMASEYLPPLAPSWLDDFVDGFLEPDNLAHLRHLAAIKFVAWLRQRSGSMHDLQSQGLSNVGGAVATTTGSLLDDPSKSVDPTCVKWLLPHVVISN